MEELFEHTSATVHMVWSETALKNYYRNVHSAFGLYGIINHRIKRGMKETPKEMAQLVIKIYT